MKRLTKVLFLLTLFTLVFSWTALFGKPESPKENEEEELQESFSLKNLGLSYLKDYSLKDLVNFELPDVKSHIGKLKNIISMDIDPAHYKGVDEFWTGFFESLGLPKPTDLINCFGTLTGHAFFRKIKALNTLLQRSKSLDSVRLHTDYIQFEVIMKTLEQLHHCMAPTSDFERMTDALGIPNDPQVLKKARYLYFQAKFSSLAEDFQPIVDEIENKNFIKVGKLFGDLYKNSVQDFKKSGQYVLAYQAFGNGINGYFGLPLPTDSLDCYDSTETKLLLEFFKGFSHAVSEGKWYKADHSAGVYWETEGKGLLEKISKKSKDCDYNSSDTKELGKKIGMDLGGKEFRDKLWKYLKDHNIMFYSYLSTMNEGFERGDYLLAGSAYAHLLEAVAKSS